MPRFLVAERAGFEPAVPCGTRALQARALGRTTQPLQTCGIIAQSVYCATLEGWGAFVVVQRASAPSIRLAVLIGCCVNPGRMPCSRFKSIVRGVARFRSATCYEIPMGGVSKTGAKTSPEIDFWRRGKAPPPKINQKHFLSSCGCKRHRCSGFALHGWPAVF